MATFEKRATQDGITVYRVKVRRKGYLPQTATTMAVEEWHWCEDNPVRKLSKPYHLDFPRPWDTLAGDALSHGSSGKVPCAR